jgi:hypothetical protein
MTGCKSYNSDNEKCVSTKMVVNAQDGLCTTQEFGGRTGWKLRSLSALLVVIYKQPEEEEEEEEEGGVLEEVPGRRER